MSDNLTLEKIREWINISSRQTMLHTADFCKLIDLVDTLQQQVESQKEEIISAVNNVERIEFDTAKRCAEMAETHRTIGHPLKAGIQIADAIRKEYEVK